MKKILILLEGLFFVICAQAAFFPSTEDVPLMEGILLQENDDFSFDTPAGQILIFEGKTGHTQSDVLDFYKRALLEMGWKITEKNIYQRDNDTFQISFPRKGVVRFDIELMGIK